MERLFSSSLVVVVSHTKPRQMNVYHFKKGTEICNYSYSSNILSIRLNRQVSRSLQITRLLLIGTEEKDGCLSRQMSLKQASNLKRMLVLRPSILGLLHVLRLVLGPPGSFCLVFFLERGPLAR